MVNVFGQAVRSCLKILDVVQFKVRYSFEDKFISVEALVYPVICCRSKKSRLISIAQKEYAHHISKLSLADIEDENKNFLIGIDFSLEKLLMASKVYRHLLQY